MQEYTSITPGKSILLLFCFILFPIVTLYSQDIAIGQWRHHLPNNTVVSIAEKPGYIYAATPYGILEYDMEYNSVRKYDKVSGLSDFGINVLRYSDQKDLLLMGYQNGNIDVFMGGGFFSIPDIRQANILGSKSINNIFFFQEMAYLSCDFGIVVIDLNQFVILDTWFIGPEGSSLNVFDLVKTETTFYAATEAGLLKADVNAPNLADFQYWTHAPGLPDTWGRFTAVVVHNNRVFANQTTPEGDILFVQTDNEWDIFAPNTIVDFGSEKTSLRSTHGTLTVSSHAGLFFFNENLEIISQHFWYMDERVSAYDAIRDRNGNFWVADRALGIVKRIDGEGFESIILDGPAYAHSYGLAHNGGTLWVAPGGAPNTYNDRGIFLFNGAKWNVFNRSQFRIINNVRDIHSVTPHPGNPDRVFAASWIGGLLEFDVNDGLVNFYNDSNSTLQLRSGVGDFIRVGGSAFDSKGNLWVSNSDADHFISVKTPNNQWMSYPHNGNVGSGESVGKIVVDNADQKWVAMPRAGGILVFKESSLDNNQSFDLRKLGTQEGNGSLPSNRVLTLAKDKDGYIWAGTSSGVVVFYSPQAALRGTNFDAQSIIVVQDGFAARLFDGETINSIFVDGANKKWVGTLNSGAFLLSPDGRETILHFTRSNSPLPSNNILDISVDPQTGEVFFATELGLVSFRGFATEGQRQHSDVYAFPNPVRPGYSGYIAIKGLVVNARVKITDIAGNLVHEGFAEGGQFVWDGYSLNGRRPGSGVYLVFSTDPVGEETMVTKIMYLK